MTTSTTSSTTSTSTTTKTEAKTEPATEAATTKAVETEATTTAVAPTPAALVSNTTVDEQYYYGCGQGHWDNDEGMRQNNTCRFLCNCGFEKDSEGEFTSVPLTCDPTNGQCKDNSCPDGFEGTHEFFISFSNKIITLV